MIINGKYYSPKEEFPENMTVPDCIVDANNKVGQGHGESKFYIASKKGMYTFYGNSGFTAKCFMLKSDLISYMKSVKHEYLEPTQEYAGKKKLPSLWYERYKKIEEQDDILFFTIKDQNQIAGSRGYINSTDDAYKIIRQIALPGISFIHVEKFIKAGTPIFYWKLFADFIAENKKEKSELPFNASIKNYQKIDSDNAGNDMKQNTDPVFEEERGNLDKKLKTIKGIATSYRDEADKLYKESAEGFAADYDDRDRIKDLRRKSSDLLDLAELYESYLDSPYYGRMDFDITDKNKEQSQKTVYVGKNGIHKGKDDIVIDWRTPVGGFYAQTRDNEFTYNGVQFELLLRRALTIENSVLLRYNTLYEGFDELEGDVVDPFLRSVLKDKRRQKQLTDIIRSIQENQNEIIRRPLRENFIVQGCAGSGKTMILLHRLSVLKYNDRNIDLSKIRIITPNRAFGEHISDLSRQLEIDRIKRHTVEEFYGELIEKYRRTNNEIVTDVFSEKTLNREYLREIYSLDFQNKVKSKYEEYWHTAMETINNTGIIDWYFKKNQENHEFRHNYSTYKYLSSFITSENDKITKSTEIENEEDARNRNLRKLEALSETAKKTGDLYAVSKEKTLEALIDISQKTKDDLSFITEHLRNLKAEQSELDEKIKKLYEKEKEKAILETGLTSINSIEEIENLPESVSEIVLGETENQRKELEKLRDEYKAIPVYNFGRRNRIRNNSEILRKEIISQTKDIIRNYIGTFGQSNKQNLEEAEKKAVDLKDAVNQEDEKKYVLDNLSIHIESIKTLIESGNELIDFEPLIKLYPAYKESFEAFNKAAADYYESEKELRKTEELLTKLQENIRSLKEDQKTRLELLQKSRAAVDLLRADNVRRSAVTVFLSESAKKYGITYNESTKRYRYKMYLDLLFSSLYYERPASIPTFINIDEAQDISLAEYTLLKNIIGNNCIFNLYGDVNQVVYSYKGINDWEILAETISPNVYVLNENYRNTVQITDFCNKQFGAEIKAIGLNGEEVSVMSLDSALEEIIKLKTNNSDSRAAVIYRTGISSITDSLRKKLLGLDISWGIVDDKSLSVITVESAKGLEFEYVVTVDDQMEDNERYISYTRALEKLIVVKDHFDIVNPDNIGEYKDESIQKTDQTIPEIIDENPDNAKQEPDSNPAPFPDSNSVAKFEISEFDNNEMVVLQILSDYEKAVSVGEIKANGVSENEIVSAIVSLARKGFVVQSRKSIRAGDSITDPEAKVLIREDLKNEINKIFSINEHNKKGVSDNNDDYKIKKEPDLKYSAREERASPLAEEVDIILEELKEKFRDGPTEVMSMNQLIRENHEIESISRLPYALHRYKHVKGNPLNYLEELGIVKIIGKTRKQ